MTFLYTNDLGKSVQFYGEILGLEQVLDQGSCKIFKTSSTGFIGICSCNDQPSVSPEGIIVTLVTSDVDDWYNELSVKGVRFEKPPSENPNFNIYHCFLRDPDGYQLEIQQFKDPNWPKPL